MLTFQAGFNSFRRQMAHTLEGRGIAVHQMARPASAKRAPPLANYLIRCNLKILVRNGCAARHPDRDNTVFQAWWHELHPDVRSAQVLANPASSFDWIALLSSRTGVRLKKDSSCSKRFSEFDPKRVFN
jgi:hypothetical protein